MLELLLKCIYQAKKKSGRVIVRYEQRFYICFYELSMVCFLFFIYYVTFFC